MKMGTASMLVHGKGRENRTTIMWGMEIIMESASKLG